MNFKDVIIEQRENIIEKEISLDSYRMPYQIKIGRKYFNNKRALFILHGHGANQNYAKFYDDEWLIITPLDIYGTDSLGTWWLGEDGNFFTLKLLQQIISIVKTEYDVEKIFFWGTSMGGYGALLHGTLCHADAVYSHMPQVKLEGTSYTDGENRKYYQSIFRNSNLTLEETVYKDLVQFFMSIDKNQTPVYFLSQNIFDYPNYVSEHFLPLVQVLDKLNLAYSVEMNLEVGHKVFRNVHSTVEGLFRPNFDKIEKWKRYQSLSYNENIINDIELIVRASNNKVIVDIVDSMGLYAFACYLYINNRLQEKKHYQKSPKFIFSVNNAINNESIIKVKYYFRFSKNSKRIPKDFVIKYGDLQK